MNYHDHLSLDDVIEITNADRPAWCHGLWRVYEITQRRVVVRPLNGDLTIDSTRDNEHEYVIANGGITSNRRGNPNLRIGPTSRR